MIMECARGGADIVKIQVYRSHALFGSLEKRYLEFSKEEIAGIEALCMDLEIGFMASVFSPEDVDHLASSMRMPADGIPYVKLAARSGDDAELCKYVQATFKNAQVIVSNPSEEVRKLRVTPIYTVRSYPAMLSEVEMPDFYAPDASFIGYSDHTYGIAACLKAAAYGAQYIEKHYTLSKYKQCNLEKAHLCSMNYEELKQIRELGDAIRAIR